MKQLIAQTYTRLLMKNLALGSEQGLPKDKTTGAHIPLTKRQTLLIETVMDMLRIVLVKEGTPSNSLHP